MDAGSALYGRLCAAGAASGFPCQPHAVEPLLRWVLFAQLAWLLAAAGMGFEAVFFNTAGIVNGLMLAILHLISLSLPVVLFSGAVTVLFRPVPASPRQAAPRVRMKMVQMGA